MLLLFPISEHLSSQVCRQELILSKALSFCFQSRSSPEASRDSPSYPHTKESSSQSGKTPPRHSSQTQQEVSSSPKEGGKPTPFPSLDPQRDPSHLQEQHEMESEKAFPEQVRNGWDWGGGGEVEGAQPHFSLAWSGKAVLGVGCGDHEHVASSC